MASSKKENLASMDEKCQTQDLTEFDFTHSPLYKAKEDGVSFPVEQLQNDEIIVRSWGTQEMKAGDFVVLKPNSKGGVKRSGVRREAFETTYEEDPEKLGHFKKVSYIKAVQIHYPFQFMGVDSKIPERAPAGSFLVLNLDRNQNPIMVNGKRDIFFYTQEDLENRYDLLET